MNNLAISSPTPEGGANGWFPSQPATSNPPGPGDPVAATDPPQVGPGYTGPRILSRAEAYALLASVDDQPRGRGGPDHRSRDALAVHLLLTAGVRATDLLTLKIRDFALQDGRLVLTVAEQHGPPTVRLMPAALGRALHRHLAHRPRGDAQPAATPPLPAFLASLPGEKLLLTTGTGRRLDQPALIHTIRRLAGQARIDDPKSVTPSTLHRTFAAIAAQYAAEAVANAIDASDNSGRPDPEAERRPAPQSDRAGHADGPEPAVTI